MERKALVLAVVLCAVGLISWEYYWRSKDYPIGPEDTMDLWAHQRRIANNAGPDDIVLLGSSRVLFDIQLDAFEQESGIRPIQLAAGGSHPLASYKDLIENTDFNGTVILGITPPLYFSPPSREVFFWDRMVAWIENYEDQTYADRFSFWANRPLQNSFAFLCASEETFCDELDLRTIIEMVPTRHRVFHEPDFPVFQFNDWERNTTMWRADTDTAIANTVMKYWEFAITPPPNPPPPEAIAEMKQGVVDMTVGLTKQLTDRGGKLILVRCPSNGFFRGAENGGFPRAEHYDWLVRETGAASYHYEDHDYSKDLNCPELSHLSGPDAIAYTTSLVAQMIDDGVISTNQ